MGDGLSGMPMKDWNWPAIGCGCLLFVLLAGIVLGISLAQAIR
jgi:hypothetical protein